MQGSPDSGIWEIFVCGIGNPGNFTCGIQNPERSWGAFLWDYPHQDQWPEITRIMVDQMKWRALLQSRFIGSFDLPWSEWSRITDPDPDQPKGPHPWIPKTVLYSWISRRVFGIPGTGFWILCQWSGFRSPIIRRIPHSLICIPNSKTQDSGFYKNNFSGIRIPLQGANQRFLWLLMIIRDFKIQWRGRHRELQKNQWVL